MAPRAQAQSVDTTTLGGDAAHRNVWAGTGLRPPLDLAWQVAADPVAPPLVTSGKVIVQTSTAVSALDAATGSTVWSVPLSGRAELASDGTRVFLALPTGVAALSLADGKIVWTAPGAAATGPVAAGGRVFTGTSGGDVVAYAAGTGALQWRTPSLMTGARPAVAGDRVYIVGGCRAAALAAATGLPQWTSGTCLSDTGARTVTAGALVWGEDAALYLASDGTKVSGGPGPATAGGGDVFGNPLRTAVTSLVAADAGTFAPKWTWKPLLPSAIAVRPAVVDGSVFTVADTGGAEGAFLAALDPGTGREQWSGFLPAGKVPAGAIAAGPGVLVVPFAGGLIALRNAATGPLGVEATLPRNVVPAGSKTTVTGTIASGGHGLVGPRAVGLQADPFPFSDSGYTAAGFAIAGRSGFSFTVPVTRNTRYRIAADGVFYPPTTVYAQPQLKVSYRATKTALVVRATLRIASAAGLDRSGRVAVYRLRSGQRRATRLGAGRSSKNGVGHFTVHIPATLKKADRVIACLRNSSRQGFGPRNALDRHCGDRSVTLPKAAAATNRGASVPKSGTPATRLLRTGT